MSEYPPVEDMRKVGERPSLILAPLLIINDLISNRFLVKNLVKKELRNRYRNALFGYTWTIIEPALLASVYWFLFIMLVGNTDEKYPIWVILGVIVWGCFGKSLQSTVSSLTRNVGTIHLVYFPRSIFPFTSVLSNIWISLMSCLIIIPLIIIYDITPTIYILLVPLGVILAGVMGLAVGLMFAPFNCIQRDVEHLLRFVVRAGFFVSPVMWTAEMAMERGTFGELVLYNPMVTPITMVRHGFVGNSTGLPFMVIASSLFFIFAMWIIGTIVFNKYERNAVKYL